MTTSIFQQRSLYHFVNGVWSGIPLCCIRYWLDGNDGMSRDKPDPYWEDTEYVRCNKCVSKRRVKTIRLNGSIWRFLVTRP